MTDSIQRLYDAVLVERGQPPGQSRTAKLFTDGRAKMAKKLVEEAAEVALECVQNDRDAVIRETTDLIYNLTVLLADMGVHPAEVWHEMNERESTLGIAEKLPKE